MVCYTSVRSGIRPVELIHCRRQVALNDRFVCFLLLLYLGVSVLSRGNCPEFGARSAKKLLYCCRRALPHISQFGIDN